MYFIETKVRYYSWIKPESIYASDDKLGRCFRLVGDCCFNFNKSKYSAFKKILGEENIAMLDKCCKMHHNKVNFAIMPATGGLNIFKGKVGFDDSGNLRIPKEKEWLKSYDRFDTLIYFLSRFYSNNNEYFYASHKFYSFEDFKQQLAVWERKYNAFPMRPLNRCSPKDILFSFPNCKV